MGYCSDVALVLANEHTSVFDLENKSLVEATKVILRETETTLYHFHWVKWYEDTDDVRRAVEFLNCLPDEDYHLYVMGEGGEFEETGDLDDTEFGVCPRMHLDYEGLEE